MRFRDTITFPLGMFIVLIGFFLKTFGGVGSTGQTLFFVIVMFGLPFYLGYRHKVELDQKKEMLKDKEKN